MWWYQVVSVSKLTDRSAVDGGGACLICYVHASLQVLRSVLVGPDASAKAKGLASLFIGADGPCSAAPRKRKKVDNVDSPGSGVAVTATDDGNTSNGFRFNFAGV